MRGYHLRRNGLDGLTKVDLPEPVAGRGQVLVKVHACSLNHRGLGVAAGR